MLHLERKHFVAIVCDLLLLQKYLQKHMLMIVLGLETDD